VFLHAVRAAPLEAADGISYTGNLRARVSGTGLPLDAILPGAEGASRIRPWTSDADFFFRSNGGARSRPSMVGQRGDRRELPGRMVARSSRALFGSFVVRKEIRR